MIGRDVFGELMFATVGQQLVQPFAGQLWTEQCNNAGQWQGQATMPGNWTTPAKTTGAWANIAKDDHQIIRCD